jgi:predicted anti-sigma-YlaC factor YlaD
LTLEQCAGVDSHLDVCDDCRDEYRQALQLKDLLENQPTFDPGEDYWRETTELILARAEASPREIVLPENRRPVWATGRATLARAAASFAVSLGVLVSAVVIGSSQTAQIADSADIDNPFVVTASVRDAVGTSGTELLTAAESSRLARGTLLLGAPGMLGKGIAFRELLASTK